MKTQKKKTLFKASMVMAVIIIMTSCGNSQEKKAATNVTAPQQDLQTCVILGDYQSVLNHIKAGTDLNQVEPMGGSTALISSIVFGRSDISRALIEAGADLEIKNNEGSTALFVAAMFCRTETLKKLLISGANPELRNNYGSTPLETVEIPFENIRPVFDEVSKGLGPLGLKLDYDRIKEQRPVVADLLRKHININD
ncbi:MAG TPA: ankyrin repeat domain-containing protein [Bacteroidales bacterium]|nr:ankyrin repeat domain-containing protein [Bacteroidales bacterium]